MGVRRAGGPAQGLRRPRALVTQGLGRDPLSGDCYLFVNATRKRAKVLLWDGTGLCIYAKRLEQGRFACLWRDAAARVVHLTMSELQLFLEGSALVGRITPVPRAVCRRQTLERSCVMRDAMM